MDKCREFVVRSELLIAALIASTLIGCGAPHPTGNPNEPLGAGTVPPSIQPPSNLARTHRAVHRNHAQAKLTLSRGSGANVLVKLHRANVAEIAVATIAAKKAATAEVHEFADQLIDDHRSVDRTVMAMARREKIRLREPQASYPKSTDREHEPALMRKLDAARGEAFDDLFLQQADSHLAKLILTLQHDREDTGNERVEELIDKVLPIFKEDQKIAEILMDREQA